MLDEAVRGLEGLARRELAGGLAAGLSVSAVRALVPGARRVLTPGLVAALAAAWALDAPLVAVAGAVAAVAGGDELEAIVPPRAAGVVVAVVLAVATGTAVASRDPAGGVLVALAGALAWSALAARPRRGRAGTAIALMTALGWYAGLPDTEAAVAVAGALAGSLAAAWSVGWAPFAVAGAGVVVVGGAGRSAAIVGSLVCLGWLLVPAAARSLRAHPAWPFVLHAGFVVYGSRVVARQPGTARLLVALAPAAALAAWSAARARR